MSMEARYFRVGLFVLVGLALIVALTIFLGGTSLFQERITIETYFDESVSGLEIGSPVKMRGVTLGQVAHIGFVYEFYELDDPEQPLAAGAKVLVHMDVTPTQPDITPEERRQDLEKSIDEGLRVRIASSGITGTSFIQADYLDPKSHPPMEIFWEPENLYVPSAPSTIATLTSAAERILQRLEVVDVERVVENLDALLVSTREKVEAVEFDRLELEAFTLMREMRETVRTAEVAELSARAQTALDELDAVLVRTRSLVEGGRYDLQSTLENLRVASEDLRELSNTARSFPSFLLLGQPPRPSPVTNE